ncbi:hypothetical protein KFE25_009452 [Diacronema lutheri]|uniref:Plastid lipid-associated protein/fibrillin conserved domain-containing protein n=2 Tax=Diacronema lutheri TaxID=2081491 RepID=A0A8J5XXU8_DIALT|nr:hypothetical protein KFE25_009452 [Diacronema lutheri]
MPGSAVAPASADDAARARAELKAELLEVVQPLGCGFDSTQEQRDEVLEIVTELEALNPTKRPLESDVVVGMWDLVYTSSPSVRNVQGVMGVNQWFKGARMTSFVQDVRREPNYIRYIEKVQFPSLLSRMVGNVAVAEGFWTQQDEEPDTMVTDATKVTIGPMKYDSEQWQSLRCLMIQELTYCDDEVRIQHGLVPNIIWVFRKLPPGAVVEGA